MEFQVGELKNLLTTSAEKGPRCTLFISVTSGAGFSNVIAFSFSKWPERERIFTSLGLIKRATGKGTRAKELLFLFNQHIQISSEFF